MSDTPTIRVQYAPLPALSPWIEAQNYELPFLLPTGCVDLLAMRAQLPEEDFRRYVALRRSIRSNQIAMRRQSTFRAT
jgi:hypothetical protein